MTDTKVIFPLMGEGVNEATLIKWLKKPGEPIKKDEPLVEIATDKVDTEIVSPVDGYFIAAFVKEGETIQVGQTLAQISSDAKAKVLSIEKPASKGPRSAAAFPHAEPRLPPRQFATGTAEFVAPSRAQHVPMPATYAGPVRSSPLVRKLAREQGISLGDLTGTGLHGRVTKDDVLRYLDERSVKGASVAPGFFPSFSFDDTLFRVPTEQRDGKEWLDGVEVERVPMSRIRKLTAEHMLRSVRVSPHVTTTFEIDMSNVVAVKSNLEKDFAKEHGSKLTFTAFFIHASVAALKRHPEVNASVDGDTILFKKTINIGCAVATDHGLIVPVMKNINDLPLLDIAVRLNDIVSRARGKRLSPEEVQGGSFSITNPGIYGSLHSQPIINQPQVAILSTGAIVERPVVKQGKVVIKPLVQVGLTFDHRVVDGEGGAKFLRSLQQELETFQSP